MLLGEVAPIVRRPIKLDRDAKYREIGARSFGRGLFEKPEFDGAAATWEKPVLIAKGDLVFSNIKAWEGAISWATEEHDGCIASHRYITCVPQADLAVPEFLARYLVSREGLAHVGQASRGSADRNRTLNLTDLAAIPVPVPPLIEQVQIVQHLEKLKDKTQQIEAHLDAADGASAALLLSLHHQLAAGRTVRLGEVIDLSEFTEAIVPTGQYPQVGVRGFGGGLFPKPAISGVETAYKGFHRLYAGAIVLSQVKGWEGAIARCPEELAGWFVSPEYRTFRCREGHASSDYLGEIFKTEWFWKQLQDATRGVGARRERTRPEQFLNIELLLPTLKNQLKIVEIMNRQAPLKAKHAAIRLANAELLPATLERVFAAPNATAS
jgi:type I restriction enzyme S subunit